MLSRSIHAARAMITAAAAALAMTLCAGASFAAEPEIDLAALKGKVVYLDFWASWCVPCRESFPWLNDLQRSLKDEGLVVIGVNVDRLRSDAEHFLADYPAEFRLAYDPDGALAERYKLTGMPSSILIDRNGKTVFVHEGFRLKERTALENRVRALVAAR